MAKRKDDSPRRIYLDHAATTPLRPEVVRAMQPFAAQCFGNPSSLHLEGRQAKAALEEARAAVVHALGAHEFDLAFASCGTEANHSALIGAVLAAKGRLARPHVVTTAIEHAAVLELLPLLETLGAEVTLVPCSEQGVVEARAIEALVRPETSLVSVMAVNNETGVIQDVSAIGAALRAHDCLVHVDAVQHLGKLELDLSTWPVDLVTLSAHKIYGPKGGAALVARRGIQWEPLLRGGGQEGGKRSGTPNVAAAVGFAQAVELAQAEWASEAERQRQLRDRLEADIQRRVPEAIVNGGRQHRVGGLLNVSFPFVEGESLVRRLDARGVAVSTGSACNIGAHKPSHVLRAMQRSAAEVRGSIRFSLGRGSTADDLAAASQLLFEELEVLRRIAPSGSALPST